jgi:hypothetical protein
METWRHGDMETGRLGDSETGRRGDTEIWGHGHGDIKCKRKTEAQAIFLNPFTVCVSRKRKFVPYPFVDEETKARYPVANGWATSMDSAKFQSIYS